MENKESFNELYTRLYNENFNELESLREKAKSKGIKIILGVVATIISFTIYPIIGVILAIVLLILATKDSIKTIKENGAILKDQVNKNSEMAANVFKGEDSYISVFKQKIIGPLIQNVFSEAEYKHFLGIRESEYMKGHWENYDLYGSEDKIVTSINVGGNESKKLELCIAEVHTQNEHRDDEGHTSYSTVFHGLAGNINLPKDIACYIKVEKNSFNLFGGPKDRLEMDMSEFEKMFDVKTDDRIKTMQILTPDIMMELMDLVKTSKVKFEFYINHDIMHIRFHTGEMFEPEIFGKSMQHDKLKKCFDKIEMVRSVTEHICNVIHSTEL